MAAEETSKSVEASTSPSPQPETTAAGKELKAGTNTSDAPGDFAGAAFDDENRPKGAAFWLIIRTPFDRFGYDFASSSLGRSSRSLHVHFPRVLGH